LKAILEAVVGALFAALRPRAILVAENLVLREQLAILWSRRRIAGELAKLGYAVDKDTVAKYMPKPAWRPRRPPPQRVRGKAGGHVTPRGARCGRESQIGRHF
jgi:hypothetical protein